MYIIRLDDAAEHWDRLKWTRVHDLLAKWNVRPLVAIIPHNKDPKLLNFPQDKQFWDCMRTWVREGWIPALHGYRHILKPVKESLNPVNLRSEFAEVPLEEQRCFIREGTRILRNQGLDAKIFVAPAHTFDQNTLAALRLESNIRIISDTIARDIYFKDDFWYVPQQAGQVRPLPLSTVTFCYHPNTMTEPQFLRLEKFLRHHAGQFGPPQAENLPLRKIDKLDSVLRRLYFFRRRSFGGTA